LVSGQAHETPGVPGSYIVMRLVGVTECGALWVSGIPNFWHSENKILVTLRING
jgi:hypothetical protein